MANVVANVANLMSEATAPHMGKLVINVRALIISKPFVIPRLQPGQRRALIEARSSLRDTGPLGVTVAMAKEVANNINKARRRRRRTHRSRKHMR